MEKQSLEEILQEIEKFCLEQKIQIFYGSRDETQSPDICIKSDQDDWQRYLLTLKAYDAKVLIISKEINEFEPDGDILESYSKTLDHDEHNEYLRALKIVSNVKGKLAFFILNFFVGYVTYQFRKHADWIDQYILVHKCFEADDDNDSQVRLTESEKEDISRQVIEEAKFIQGRDRFERQRIGQSLSVIKDVSHPIDRLRILEKAEELFSMEILPGIEEELRKKIRSLKEEGHSKVAVKSKLQLTDTTLNKHWY